MSDPAGTLEEDSIYKEVVAILKDITEEWDIGPITPTTVLGNLGIESVSLVYFIAELQKKYRLKDRLFKKLIAESIDLMSLQLADVVEFIREMKD